MQEAGSLLELCGATAVAASGGHPCEPVQGLVGAGLSGAGCGASAEAALAFTHGSDGFGCTVGLWHHGVVLCWLQSLCFQANHSRCVEVMPLLLHHPSGSIPHTWL